MGVDRGAYFPLFESGAGGVLVAVNQADQIGPVFGMIATDHEPDSFIRGHA